MNLSGEMSIDTLSIGWTPALSAMLTPPVHRTGEHTMDNRMDIVSHCKLNRKSLPSTVHPFFLKILKRKEKGGWVKERPKPRWTLDMWPNA